MDQLSRGMMARSRKENERRPAIHPLHIERIEAGLRRQIYLERGRTHHGRPATSGQSRYKTVTV